MRAARFKAPAVFTATLFVFFLTTSAPHRVHHLFEQISHSNWQGSHIQHFGPSTSDTENKNHHRSSPIQTNCPIQQTAQSCQLSPIELVAIHLVNEKVNQSFMELAIPFGRLNPFRLSSRAPPPA